MYSFQLSTGSLNGYPKTVLICVSLFCVMLISAARTNATTYTVSNVSNSGSGSLRQAIIDSNTAQGSGGIPNVIVFNIAGGVVRTVNLASPLPDITYALTIDGTTMPGFAGSPLFELNGTSAGAGANGLTNRVGDFVVKSLIINRFSGNGIESVCPSGGCQDFEHNNILVTGCYIGVDKLGVAASPNGGNGIYHQPHRAFAYSTIGGPLASERNIISGNGKNGILIRRQDYSFAQVNILNSYVGTNFLGVSAIPNALNGIATEDSPGSQVTLVLQVGFELGNFGVPLTPTAADRNVISGNANSGIFSATSSVDFDIKNSYIGTNAAGTADLGNTQDGIKLTATGNTSVQIGGTGSLDGNVISGNDGYGIDSAMSFTTIENNRIGTNALGTAAVGNSTGGIRLFTINAFPITGCYIGGSALNQGNLISGNTSGIILETGADGTQIQGNKIGTNAAGTGSVGNTQYGIVVKAKNIGIGLANIPLSANIIGGNGATGILISDFASNVDIFNNYIGTNANDAVLANNGDGILATGCASNIRVGADASIIGAANTIAHNASGGVSLWDISPCLSIPPASVNVAVRRNSIYSNGSLGIELIGTFGVTANDTGDGDNGPNGLQNYPILLKASPTQLYGTLNSKPNQTYTADFFQTPSCHAFGNGEGKTLLGSATLTTNASGNAIYNLTGFPIAVGQVITATATDSSGNTSEFSQCLTATNSPGNISFNAATGTAVENSGFAAISVDRVGGASGTVTVDYTTSNGTAIGGVDYTTTSNTLTFLNTETIKTIFVPLINNTKDEPSRTFNVTLSNPTGGAFLGGLTTHTFTITDDDPPPSVSIGDISVLEGNQGPTTFSFPVILSAASGFTTSVNYSTANGTATATQDYQSTTGTVTFAPGEVLKTATVTVNGDLVPELNETFLVNLATPVNLTISDGQATGTILDDDAPGKIALAFSTYSVSESTGNAIITLTRTNGLAGAVAVDYQTSNGTATAGSDYTPAFGTAVFNDGQATTSFNVPIINDAIGEGDETIFITLSSPLGGAILGTPASAVLTIFDDDGGLPPNVSIGGQIVENTLPLQGVSVTLVGSQIATAVTDAGGNYNFANLPSAGNFLVTPTLTGHSFEPVSLSFTNLAADIANANFIGSTGRPARNIHVISNSTSGGQDAIVAVGLTSQGNENSAAFSLSYDPALVFNPHVTLGSDSASASLVVNSISLGNLGVIIALPPGQSFAAGSRDLVKITFNTVPTTLFSTPLAFSDSPITRMVTDANASGLPASYSDGLIGFSQGFEADVASRPAGDGFIAVDDFTQVGRFVAGLDTADLPVSTNEFQRADCSPRGTKGDGVLAVDDFTQAGRYAAGLDQGQNAGGPTQFGGIASMSVASADDFFLKPSLLPRDIHVVSMSGAAGHQVLVSLEMDANGDENGIGFTLNYETAKLSNPVVAAGTATQGTFLIPNTNTLGKVGVIIAFSPGSTITAGVKQLVTIRFDIAADAIGSSPLTLGDSPVIRRVSSVDATPLATTFTDGNLSIVAPTAAGVSIGGRVVAGSQLGIASVSVELTNARGEKRTALTNPFGYYQFDDVQAGETYVVSAKSKRYSFVTSSQVITVSDEMSGIDFVSIE